MAKPWDRREGESEAAYAAFKVFLHSSGLVPVSSQFIETVKRETGHEFTSSTMETYQKNHKWRDRKRAYQSELLNAGMKGLAWQLTKDAAPLAKGHRKARRLVQKATIEAAERIRPFTDDAESRQFNGFLDALDKILNLALKTDLDHADQLRRISAEIRQFGGTEPAETEEVIPPIPDESGSIQYGHPEAETVLGASAGDMPGDS